MIPILYASVTEGTVPTDYGIGALTDCLSCKVTEARNGKYELTLEYPINGIHAEEILVNRIVKAKPNFNDNPQLFRIYKVGKVLNGRFTIDAQHIAYDLSGKVATSGTASSCASACNLLTNNFAGDFTITTDKLIDAGFEIEEPSSVKSWFGGKQGSILDIYGPGEWAYDNYTCTFKANRGTDRGVSIRYGLNLTQLSQIINIENLVTHIVPYAKNDELGTIAVGSKIPTGLTLDTPREKAVDFSDDVNWEDATPVITQLDTIATSYVTKHQDELTNIVDSITLGFAQLEDLADRIDLCDTVHIYFEAFGISKSAKCIETVWDTLNERYISNTFGDAKSDIADSMSQMQSKLEETPTQPQVVNIVNRATELITGNLGGYVILHDTDNDGKPDEILITNDEDYLHATEVWRWNKNGLGYATSYNGPFDTAITSDGKINANFLKVGTITDTSGHSEIDMTSGVAKLYELKAIKGFTVITQGDEDPRAQFTQDQWSTKLIMSHTDTSTPDIELIDYSRSGLEYSQLRLSNDDGTTYTATLKADADGGHVILKNANGNNAIQFFADGTYGGNWYLYNTSGNNRFHAFVGSINDDGILDLFDGNGNVTLSLVGKDGVVECGAVKPRDQIVSLWTGTLNGTAGNDEAMVPYGPYSAYLVKWRTSTSGYYQTMLIPRIDLQDSIQDTYQFNTESQYYTFYADYVGTTAYFTYRGRTSGSTAHICAIYGIY